MPLSLRAEVQNPADELIAELSRATPGEGRALALRLPEWTRAQIALFCNSRAHLRAVGRAIASVCSQESLTREGGHAGRVLFAQATAQERPKFGARPITLSSGAAGFAAKVEDIDDEDE